MTTVAEKLARFRATPPVGRRMPGRMKRRKRDPERVRTVEMEMGGRDRPLLRSMISKIGEKFYTKVYVKGPKRVDKSRSRTRAARPAKRLTTRDSRNVNRRLAAGRVLAKLARRASVLGWHRHQEAE
jgi:hypothetical protein